MQRYVQDLLRLLAGYEQAEGELSEATRKQIGLVKDENRPDPPDKATYRSEVNRRNNGRPCFDPNAKYDPVHDNLRLFPAPAYLNE